MDDELKKAVNSTEAVRFSLDSFAQQTDGIPSGIALLFARDYYPNVPFRIVANLPATITVAILDEPPDDIQVISQPDDYNGYVISYSFRETPIYTFLFTRRFFPTGSRFRLGDDPTYFSTNLNLLAVSLVRLP
ncbi:hypothetical protein SAMN05421858_2692 [Haladaptatus litoreus]|uniref:Uncharacterized protein n=1 Tax=Haladaptatus litoreus TaxID=553468 RepID=A0A1N7BQ88_9EURY|nr:hypothetical protein [Haladaptatus litoreus]SIR53498.1 hypothetical protein SAMN05421858_2692 [Haladaptatus litoreus]